MRTRRDRTSDAQNLGGVLNIRILPEHPLHKSAGFLAGIAEGREDSNQRLGQSDLDARRARPAFRQRQRRAACAELVDLCGGRAGNVV